MSRARQARRWYQPRRSRLGQRVALVMMLAMVTYACVRAVGAWRQVEEYPSVALGEDAMEVELVIPRGTSLPGVLRLLQDAEIFSERDAVYFKIFVLQRGAANRITAGRHVVSTAMTPAELLEELVRPPAAPEVKVTIPEGWNMTQVAQALAEVGFGTPEEILAAMSSPALLERLAVEGPSLEGYLFPDTYRFDLNAGVDAALGRMVRRHREVFDDLYRRYRASVVKTQRRLEWDRHDLVTLASIVEKETGAAAERPRIAGVFYNRLRFKRFTPKLLQTDPTIIYGCTVPPDKSAACLKFEGRIRRIHLRDRDNPYNTYTHEGLPPGPIANPGRAALEAVMIPEAHRFLYFVSKNDGTHVFSETVDEHESYVDRYQRGG